MSAWKIKVKCSNSTPPPLFDRIKRYPHEFHTER
ncbi:protein of unknown function [Methanoculleus bourgensis]|uniref:Uncharacterized protein n=1 Tax=Methanoculleus bourgensis TaxID=83986 RepID=A0A0X3BJZ9_9EURY|nr:protein of unknown function [Methanoculleus bourgensis]